jgi:hypothetical protein
MASGRPETGDRHPEDLIMARKSRASFQKRQKELARQQRRQEKIARRAQRKTVRDQGGDPLAETEDPYISDTDAGPEPPIDGPAEGEEQTSSPDPDQAPLPQDVSNRNEEGSSGP